ncbi:MAG: LLM class flavin-dependent oxidoreductase, partial [Rhodococcus sp.]|nr:LLM class flavin-dependent oxidoreductase [Rhodococcus sp. (in: high G+C Gram-positive bacteria)]
VRLHNLYGPTEAAIDVTAWTCGRDTVVQGTVPIGRPVANTRISVVDELLRRVPIGVPGELCIHGVQLADGYLGRPELNSERFVQGGELGERAYRTGDVVRWTEGGVLEYLGRNDHQVKIRGHRVELGEIEGRIQHIAGDIDVVVVPEPGLANDRLIAFVAGTSRPVADLREELRRELPDYMIPVRWIALEEIPLLPNGKRDVAGLQAIVIERTESASANSDDGPAAGVQRAFATVLGCTFVRPDDDFFALGGDSMRAVRLRSVVEDELDLTFAIGDLYAHPTPAALALHLGRSADPRGVTPFGLVSPTDRARMPDAVVDAYPLTSMQQGILYQFAKDQSSTVYRVVTSVAVPQQYDAERLRRSCDLVFERHPQLRISVDLTSYSEPLQLVHATVDVPIVEIRGLEDLDEEEASRRLDAFVGEARSAHFDPDRPPLLRFVVHPLGSRGFQLTAVEHHVVLDGWSDVLLFEEIVAAFGGDALRPAPVTTFADYVALEQRRSSEPGSREFWSTELHDARLPQLFGRRPVAETDVRSEITRFPIAISAATSEEIRKLAARHGVSVRTVFVAAHVLAVAVASGQNDVLTGVIANARPETADADRLIGVFLNTLPLRVHTDDRSVSELIAEVHKWDARVAPHRYVPFGILERDLRGDIHLGDLPTYVNFMDFRRADYRDGPVRMNDVRAVADTNFPAAVDFLITDDAEFTGWIDGNLGVFSADELSRLAVLHERALEALTTVDGAVPVRSIDLLDADEITELTGPTIRLAPSETVLSRIDESVRLRPDTLAVSHRDGSWTYAELGMWSDRYARGLSRLGVRRGDAVAIHLPRGKHLVSAILGVFKAGGHYIPLDPDYPVARLAAIVDDAAPRAVITDAHPDFLADVATLRPNDLGLEPGPDEARVTVQPADIAYVIYTSGSTGVPKGVQITHRNLANFLAAMTGEIGCAPDDVMLAATSVSFDISVLELLWPLTTGAHVVVADDRIAQHITSDDSTASRRAPLDVSLFFFAGGASDAEAASEGYRLLLDAALFADTHGFRAVWTPERHFDPFGGLYPNPALTSAALATITSNVHLRSGSVVAPLHDPLRLAEEWAVVDQLSGGRIGLAFAPGWNSNDFALAPSDFGDRKEVLADRVDEFSRLWRGEPTRRTGGDGQEVELVTYPRPVQPHPELWLTTVGTEATFVDAGRRGVNILTHLFGQDLDTLTERIRVYRRARAESGHEGPGTVTLMLHTYLGATDEDARSVAREPFRNYLRGAGELWRTMFASTGQEFPHEDAEDYLDAVIDVAIDRYYQDAGLFGAPGTRTELLRRIQDAGVDEVAALIDFGVPRQDVVFGLDRLHELFSLHRHDVERAGYSFSELCRRYGVTMFQATPSVMSAIVQDEDGVAAMTNLRSLLVGGEQFPSGLAAELVRTLPRTRIYNMYGPTETTIWSTCWRVEEPERGIVIGRPIANTQVHVVDDAGALCPIGVPGELWIGGDGLATGYLGRPELT